MYALVHQMRTRIVTSPAFNGDRILAAILFENTMDRDIEGRPSVDYLWNVKRVVPFLKVDKGLADEKEGAQLMKPMPALGALLDKARGKGVFGTKMRSVVKQANAAGIEGVLDQQFEVARQILGGGTGADHRARGGHPLSGQGRSREAAQGRHPAAAERVQA